MALGSWLDHCQMIGIEGDFFQLASQSENFSAGSTGDPILARPFLDASTGRPNAELVSFPGFLAGNITATSSATGLLGADALLRINLCRTCKYQLDVIGGYRYLQLSDQIGVREDLVSTNPSNPNFVPLGTTFQVTDRFDTNNEFHGLEIGLKGSVRRGRWTLQGRAQVAVGNNHEVVNVFGSTVMTVPGTLPVSSQGGLLALPSNIGRFTKDQFDVIPELAATVGWQVTRRIQAFAGYTFLYWGDVVRAGDQIDLTVNPNLLPGSPTPGVGPARPLPLFTNSSFWAQGISLGLEFRY